MSIDPETMEELLATETARLALRPLRAGETVEGAIAAVAGDEATVDLGDRPAGVIPQREADPTRDRLILSEKAATQKLRRDRKALGTVQLAEGDVRDGIVVGVTSYGLFVDVGVADGLVHRSEITWAKGVEPTSLYRLGDAVKVRVVGIDRDRQRISLSIKRLGTDPWEQYVDQLETGQTVDATVTRVMPYGAFARIADGVEGLMHVSEIAADRATDLGEARRAGDVLPVRIVAIDRERRRLSLSARLADRT